MSPINNIGYILHHLSFVLARQSDQVLQEQLGIGFSSFKVLLAIQIGPSVQQRQIADNLGQTEASISRQIKLMHSQGLLVSTKNPQNKREHITRATPKGERLTDKANEVLNAYHSPMFQNLTEEQQKQLVEILTIMHDHTCIGSVHHLNK